MIDIKYVVLAYLAFGLIFFLFALYVEYKKGDFKNRMLKYYKELAKGMLLFLLGRPIVFIILMEENR